MCRLDVKGLLDFGIRGVDEVDEDGDWDQCRDGRVCCMIRTIEKSY